MYGEGVGGMGQPGFKVVKKNEVSETAEDEPITDLNVKEWEVSSRRSALTSLPGTHICVVSCLRLSSFIHNLSKQLCDETVRRVFIVIFMRQFTVMWMYCKTLQ